MPRYFEGLSVMMTATLTMGVAVWAAHGQLSQLTPGTSLALQLLRVFGSITIGIAVLIAAARLLRLSELDQAMRQLVTRFTRAA